MNGVGIEDLPDEVLIKIFERLSGDEVQYRASLVCRGWRRICTDYQVARRFYNSVHPTKNIEVQKEEVYQRYIRDKKYYERIMKGNWDDYLVERPTSRPYSQVMSMDFNEDYFVWCGLRATGVVNIANHRQIDVGNTIADFWFNDVSLERNFVTFVGDNPNIYTYKIEPDSLVLASTFGGAGFVGTGTFANKTCIDTKFDESQLVAVYGCTDGKLILFNVENNQALHELSPHHQGPRVVRFSETNNLIYSGGYDANILVQDPRTPEVVATISTGSALTCVSFLSQITNEDRFLFAATYSGVILCYDARRPNTFLSSALVSVKERIYGMGVGGDVVVVGCRSFGRDVDCRVWNVNDLLLNHSGSVFGWNVKYRDVDSCISTDSSRIVTMYDQRVAVGGGNLSLYDFSQKGTGRNRLGQKM